MKIPEIGLGTWQMADDQARQAVEWALAAGYRHIDTASYYKNETGVGQGIKNSAIDRDKIWVTTKLFPTQFLNPAGALKASLKRLGTDYIDLYLVHWPPPVEPGHHIWRVMEQLHAKGLAKNIGVSNYGLKRLLALLDKAKLKPFANQIEVTPYRYNQELIKFCQDQGIVVEAYSPLTRGHRLHDKKLVDIANGYKKSTAQVLIRWCIQRDLIPLPKSRHEARIKENFDVFDFKLAAKDMATLDSLNEDKSYLLD